MHPLHFPLPWTQPSPHPHRLSSSRFNLNRIRYNKKKHFQGPIVPSEVRGSSSAEIVSLLCVLKLVCPSSSGEDQTDTISQFNVMFGEILEPLLVFLASWTLTEVSLLTVVSKIWKRMSHNALKTTHSHRSIGYHKQPQPLAESTSLNVLKCVTVFDTSVTSTLSPLPSPLDTTFPRST